MKLSFKTLPAIAAAFVTAGFAVPAIAEGVDHPPSSLAELKAFPEAEAGQKRHVITVPAKDDESALKVELIVGKTMVIDCNHHRFGGTLDERTAEGWGYNYYVLDTLGVGMSTLMGCPENSAHEAFVRGAQEQIVRYNSRLPLVVYTPEDVEVRYRIWEAGEERKAP